MRWILLSVVPSLIACETAASQPSPPHETPPRKAPGTPVAAPPATVVHTPKELIDHKADFVGKTLDVDIYESLLDDEHSSIAPPGGYTVEVQDVGASRFTVLRGLPKNTTGPVRVTGKLTEGRLGLELSVLKFTALASPPPIAIKNAHELLAHPAAYANKVVEFTDSYMAGFEASYLGSAKDGPGRIWLDGGSNLEVRCAPPASKTPYDYTERQVHVVGTAYTADKRYGHLGGSQALVVARLIEYLPCAPKSPAKK